MSSSRTITLFSDQADLSQRPSSFVVSILVHGAAIPLLSFGIFYSPKVDNVAIAEKYEVRHLDLHTPDPEIKHSTGSDIPYPGAQFDKKSPPSGARRDASLAALRQTAQAERGPQTLVQPDIPHPPTPPKEIPVPEIVIWTARNTPLKTIVPPRLDKPTAASVLPSVVPPNAEINLSDVSIAATGQAAKTQPVLPSTTSPVVARAPELVQMAPSTVSNTSAQATPAAVVSLSDLRMKEGTVTLPPVNETAASNTPGVLAPGQIAGNANGKAPNEAASGSGDPGSRVGGNPGTGQGSDAGSGPGDKPTVGHIVLPRDGQFGAVVVGDSLEDRYPETAGIWSGRLAYTVYLHVGLAKSWILQYSVPRAVDAATAGNNARLEAPWPFDIVRPNLAADAIDADALMVHGFVNQAGRFEALAIVFPMGFAQAQFVLNALAQWQFRPAMQSGQSAKVEILLIIPDEVN